MSGKNKSMKWFLMIFCKIHKSVPSPVNIREFIHHLMGVDAKTQGQTELRTPYGRGKRRDVGGREVEKTIRKDQQILLSKASSGSQR